ncbi:hypothetical protein [Succinimonas sp.]|uniref:hypothetical protein n=1 Tax=Succinimonas sp. TaxID=1936151 RepID=UPI0038708291
MRTLNRNKRTIHYALLIGEATDYDEYGNETGEPLPVYGDAVELKCNVSAASGADAVQAFGNFTNYIRTMCVSDPNCPIDEKTIVWFGVDPTDPHNYIVTRKADSKNGVLYALQEVTVT